MNEAVDRVLLDRERIDRGFSKSFGISAAVHGGILIVGIALPLLFPPPPPLQIVDAFAVPLPPGGRGNPTVQEAAPAPVQPAPQPPPPVANPPAPEPPPKIIKPPKEEPRQGLPEPDAKPAKKERRSTATAPAAAGPATIASETKGLAMAPIGAGVPGGMDPNGDYYLASVQRKIWSIWNQQLRGGNQPPATFSFTIMADGSVTDVQAVQSSGIYTVDAAAQRAILTAAPFAPLPKSYGTNAFTIRAVFKPES